MSSQTLRGVPLNFQQQTPSGLLRKSRGTNNSYRASEYTSYVRERPEESVRYSSTPFLRTQQQTNYGYYSNLKEYPTREERYVKDPSPAKRVATDNYGTEKDKEYPPNFQNYFQEHLKQAVRQIELEEIRKLTVSVATGFAFTFLFARIANFLLGNGFVMFNEDKLLRITIISALLASLHAYVALPFEYRIHYRFYLNLIVTNSLRFKRLLAYSGVIICSYMLLDDVSKLCLETNKSLPDSFNNTLGVFVAIYFLGDLVIARSGIFKHKIPLTTFGVVIRSFKPIKLLKNFAIKNLLWVLLIVGVTYVINLLGIAEGLFEAETRGLVFGKGRFEHLSRDRRAVYEFYRYVITTWGTLCHIKFTFRVYKKLKAQTVARLGSISKLNYPLFVYGLINPREPLCLRASLDYLEANLRLESRRSLSSGMRTLDSYKDSLQIFFESVLKNLRAINLAIEKAQDQSTSYRNRTPTDNILQDLVYSVVLNPKELILNQYYEQINIAERQCTVAAQCFVTMRFLEGDYVMLKYDLIFKDFVEQITACKEKLEQFEYDPDLYHLYRYVVSFHTALHEAISMLEVYMKRDIRSIPARIAQPDSSFAFRDY